MSSAAVFVCLKVGSCPNDDNSVQFFYCPFPCSIQIILISESVAAEKTQDFAENLRFYCLFISFALGFQF